MCVTVAVHFHSRLQNPIGKQSSELFSNLLVDWEIIMHCESIDTYDLNVAKTENNVLILGFVGHTTSSVAVTRCTEFVCFVRVLCNFRFAIIALTEFTCRLCTHILGAKRR